MKNIVWLASYPKSGNTWIRAILYSAIHGKLNLDDIGTMMPSFGSFVSALAGNNALELPSAMALWPEAQDRLSTSTQNGRIILKTHNSLCEFNGKGFPDPNFTVGAVYVIRDARDVAISYSKHFGKEDVNAAIDSLLNDQNTLIDPHKIEFCSSWGNHVRSWLKAPFPVLFVRYEDLLSNPKNEIHKILDFLSIQPAIPIEEIISLTAFDRLKNTEESAGFSESTTRTSFFRKGTSKQWLLYPSTIFETLVSRNVAVMQKFDYL